MAFLLKEVWLWVTIVSLLAILLGSVLIILFILWLPEDLRVVGLVLLIVGWGVAGGYKDHLRAEKR